jgi:hypothetical protein
MSSEPGEHDKDLVLRLALGFAVNVLADLADLEHTTRLLFVQF